MRTQIRDYGIRRTPCDKRDGTKCNDEKTVTTDR